MFKLSQEEIDKMKEEIKELKKKIERLEWFIKINEYNVNEHKVYEGGSDLHLNYNKVNSIDENRWTNNKTPKQLEDEYKKNIDIIYTSSNGIDITKLKLAKCSQCPFTCKGQLYCTRDNVVIEQDIKTFGSITELEKNNDTNRQS